MLIPRVQVEAVLSSFGGGGGGGGGGDEASRPPQNNRPMMNRNNDWAPPSDFGSPNCMIMLSNLCYKASVEDILDEFGEFELHRDQLIRRFNDMGQPTGNACINFNSPEDADMALEKFNNAKILGRPIWLKRV